MKALKWIGITLAGIVGAVALWCGAAWLIGAMFALIFQWKDFLPKAYIEFGSVVLVLLLCMTILVVVATSLFMIAWGRSKGKSGGLLGKNRSPAS